jgi:hypothetical protein
MKSFKLSAAQGEVNIRRIDVLPEAFKADLVPVPPEKGLLIVGHSESGHHHGFRSGVGIQLLERTKDIPAGMKILYAIIDNPSELIQDAAGPHETIAFEPGVFEFRISREFNPFSEQARQVAD